MSSEENRKVMKNFEAKLNCRIIKELEAIRILG